MVLVDRWFILGLVGLAWAAVAAAGEFLGWWDQFGEFNFWAGAFLSVFSFLLNASRSQGKALLAGQGRVEAGVGRVEAGIGRVEENTRDLAPLLREIRDRLPMR